MVKIAQLLSVTTCWHTVLYIPPHHPPKTELSHPVEVVCFQLLVWRHSFEVRLNFLSSQCLIINFYLSCVVVYMLRYARFMQEAALSEGRGRNYDELFPTSSRGMLTLGERRTSILRNDRSVVLTIIYHFIDAKSRTGEMLISFAEIFFPSTLSES